MSIKKKIGGAVVATALGASLIAGGSFALFTAQAENSGNTFTTGGVTIQDIPDNGAIEATTYFNNLAPGDKESFTIEIENTDSLDAWVQVKDSVGSGKLFEGDNPLVISDNDQVVLVEAGKKKTFNFSYNFPIEAGNEYQGADGELTIEFQAVQARNNTNDTKNGPISWD